jgi:hypothetical protein
MSYRFKRIRMDLSNEAVAHNNSILGPGTLGIEVTLKTYSRLCGLGNIDPQHPDDPDKAHSSAAQESMKAPLPDDGATLVTIREDPDAIIAMAVMLLRLEKRTKFNDVLVEWVGLRDLYGSRRAEELYPSMANFYRGSNEIAAMNAIAFAIGVPDWPDLESKVMTFKRILLGATTAREMDYIISTRKSKPRRDFVFDETGIIPFIEAPGYYIEARQAGNRKYPVVAVSDPLYETHEGPCKRLTLICQPDAPFDLRGCKEALNDESARAWKLSREDLEEFGLEIGGNSRILSTPQGVGRDPKISNEEFVKIAGRFCK